MAVIIGSARIDENGHIHGGRVGDQTGREVSTQEFYVHKKGWYVLRPKSAAHANKIAERMRALCANNNYGYDQYNRLGVIEHGIDSKVKSECDCSSAVRACVKEATGKDPGNFNTANEKSALENTGLFQPAFRYTSGTTLYTGDILVTCSKGHTVIVVSGASRGSSTNSGGSSSSSTSSKPSIEQAAKNCIAGRYGNGDARKTNLKKLGFTDSEISTIYARVNAILKATQKPATAAKKASPADHFKVGSVYTTQVNNLNVRTGPGTSYSKKSRSQLTADGRKHSNSAGQLYKGTRTTCKAVKTVGSNVWINTPSGWLCAYNGSKYYVY